MNVAAVILNWKRAEDTIACARSVRETSPGTRIIVVDNASGDGSVEAVRAALPDVSVIENDANLGYAGGNNVGIAAALEDPHAGAVLVLNNDVVVRPGCIERLGAVLDEDAGIGIVGPVSLKADDPTVCDFFTGRLDLRWMSLSAPERDEPWTRPSGPQPTGYVTGSAMMIHRDVFAIEGHCSDGFDERFYLVWEDVDLSLSMTRGNPSMRDASVAVPDAEVLHGRSVSFGGEGSPLYQYFYVRNSFLIVDKHVPWWRKRRTRALLKRRYEGWLDKPETIPAVRRAIELGLAHGLEGRWGPPPDEVRAL